MAFSRLFHDYKYKLYGFVFRLTGSHASAEDAVQDIFEKLWKDHDTLLQIDSFQRYIFLMAQNQAINGFRRMAREVTILKQLAVPSEAPADVTPQGSLALKETQERLHHAIQQLPPQQFKSVDNRAGLHDYAVELESAQEFETMPRQLMKFFK